MTSAKRLKPILLLLIVGFALSGCVITNPVVNDLVVSGDSITASKEPTAAIGQASLQDDPYIYMEDDNNSIVTMYLTVRRGSAAENTDHSWADINGYSIYDFDRLGIERYQVEGLLQVGDDNGPVAGELGFGLNIPNATVQIRGATTSRMPQKSYKIELKPNSGNWKQQRTIALNKHVFDGLRFRNKLCYDLMKGIPDLVSLRTQFVHLYVKDETEGTGKGFADYGLYTQVEQPNTRFLRNHGLDSNGQFYKMNFFEFFRYPDQIKLKTDPGYNLVKFEDLLEVKGNDDHTKLIAMLEDLNNDLKPIEEVFEQHFDADNYFTWLAFNILTGNIDTQSRNFYLYSPQNSSKWYFINWDCDGALMRYESGEVDNIANGFEFGVCNYWGDILFNRVMRLPQYRKLLDEKVESLRAVITPQRIYTMVEGYQKVVKNYLFQMPDAMYSEFTSEAYDQMAQKLGEEIELNYRLYKLSLEQPMPFYCDVPVPKDGQLVFKWDPSYDLDGQDITYTFELARDHLFQDTITKKEGLGFPTATTDLLKPGKYFFRVRATNEDVKTQVALPYYVFDSVKFYGTQCFYVQEDGTVELEQTYE